MSRLAFDTSASVWGTSPTQEALESRDDVQEAHAISAADVEDLARRGRRVAGEPVGLHDVVDVGEVARLRAVAVHLERLTAQPPLDEARDDRRILRLRILTRAEDVEVAQADRLDVVEASPDRGVLFAGRLRHRVG